MGPGASERSRCVYPSSARFEGFWGRIGTQNGPLLPILPKPLNALYFKEVDWEYQTPVARDMYPAHPLGAFGRPAALPERPRTGRETL